MEILIIFGFATIYYSISAVVENYNSKKRQSRRICSARSCPAISVAQVSVNDCKDRQRWLSAS